MPISPVRCECSRRFSAPNPGTIRLEALLSHPTKRYKQSTGIVNPFENVPDEGEFPFYASSASAAAGDTLPSLDLGGAVDPFDDSLNVSRFKALPCLFPLCSADKKHLKSLLGCLQCPAPDGKVLLDSISYCEAWRPTLKTCFGAGAARHGACGPHCRCRSHAATQGQLV